MLRRLLRNEKGAVAPIVALSLVGLIAAGGLAFDYARMVSLDTELQNAADQAALAAATQLDGESDSITRAETAGNSLVQNLSLISNDGSGPLLSIETFSFFQDPEKTIPATTGPEARYVLVQVQARAVNYALTPVVSLFNSGPMTALAFAGLGSALCNVPPVMMCNPAEPTTNMDIFLPFDGDSLTGKGVLLTNGQADTPGNFGFIKTSTKAGADALAKALAYDDRPPSECLPLTSATTEPGVMNSVFEAINVRFDISVNGGICSTDTCSASSNVRKDLVKATGSGTNACRLHNQGFSYPNNNPRPYAPTTAQVLTSNYPDVMGHPRDLCHAVPKSNSDRCSQRIANGNWDRDAYFRVNHGFTSRAAWQAATGLGDNATRYQVYQWESGGNLGVSRTFGSGGSQTQYSAAPVCRPSIAATTPDNDRRRLTMAVVNCNAAKLRGRQRMEVVTVADIFLVEPTLARGSGTNARTETSDLYVEVIGNTDPTRIKLNRRSRPFLLE
jgi:Flp pilus assembly protein TadG